MATDRKAIAERHLILQQGLEEPSPEVCAPRYQSLLFQPRTVGLLVLAGMLFQSSAVFLVLGAILWWSALVPRWNPFDTVYNATRGSRAGALPLSPAPPPRRFAQGMAGTFGLLIGTSLLLEWRLAAYVLEVFMLAAVAAIVFGRFCLGSFVYHLVRGNAAFARRTLPWSRGEEPLRLRGS